MRWGALILCVVVSSSCALRPRYRDVVDRNAGPQLKLKVVDAATDKGLPNVKVEFSEWKNRYTATTSTDGSFSLPVEKKYFDENPVMVVSALPEGVSGYRLVAWSAPVVEQPAPLPVPAIAVPVEPSTPPAPPTVDAPTNK